MPELVGGSADLGPSNKTVMKAAGYYSKAEPAGRNIHFGVREHAMGCKWRGTGSGTWDGIESKIAVSINKKTGKFKIAITSWDAVGVCVRYGTMPSE